MDIEQKIACSVQSCLHYKKGNMCSLTAIQVLPCEERNNKGHESMCFSYQQS